jgi:hypothetical protein
VGGQGVFQARPFSSLGIDESGDRRRYWADVKSRLAQTGHREGRRVKGPPGARLFIAGGDQSSGLPTIKVAYTVLGDTLDICMVTVA